MNLQVTRVATTGIYFIRPNPIVFTCFDFRDLHFHTVNIRTNSQFTRIHVCGVYSGVHARPSHLDSHIIIDFFVFGARITGSLPVRA